jgi:hypothetical protein
MTSLINANNIDITFPIAGQDNDTQGFRDNYQNIQNNFNIAAGEISAIQSNVGILQAGAYSNVSVAAYLPTYTGNLSAGNLSVINISYVNQEVIATTDIVGASVTAGSVTANTITLASAIQFANLTTTQVSSISTPGRGMTVYNFTTGNIQVYNGSKWANIVLS